MSRYIISAVIDTYEGGDEDDVLPDDEMVADEFRKALEHWGVDLGDVYFTILSTRATPVDGPREDPRAAYEAFMSMPQPEWIGLLMSLGSGGVLTPIEQEGFDRAEVDRRLR